MVTMVERHKTARLLREIIAQLRETVKVNCFLRSRRTGSAAAAAASSSSECAASSYAAPVAMPASLLAAASENKASCSCCCCCCCIFELVASCCRFCSPLATRAAQAVAFWPCCAVVRNDDVVLSIMRSGGVGKPKLVKISSRRHSFLIFACWILSSRHVRPPATADPPATIDETTSRPKNEVPPGLSAPACAHMARARRKGANDDPLEGRREPANNEFYGRRRTRNRITSIIILRSSESGCCCCEQTSRNSCCCSRPVAGGRARTTSQITRCCCAIIAHPIRHQPYKDDTDHHHGLPTTAAAAQTTAPSGPFCCFPCLPAAGWLVLQSFSPPASFRAPLRRPHPLARAS